MYYYLLLLARSLTIHQGSHFQTLESAGIPVCYVTVGGLTGWLLASANVFSSTTKKKDDKDQATQNNSIVKHVEFQMN